VRHPSGNACTLTGSCCNHLVLSRHPSGNACTLTSNAPSLSGRHCCWAAIIVGLPSLSGHHCCRATILVWLPLLLGCHCCQAAIVALFPKATSKQPICCWATSLPDSLGLPLNAPFVVVIGLLLLPCSLSCNQLSAYLADPHCLFIHLVCCLLLSPCLPRIPLPRRQTTCLSHGPSSRFK
jgi:hypothetical protein